MWIFKHINFFKITNNCSMDINHHSYALRKVNVGMVKRNIIVDPYIHFSG